METISNQEDAKDMEEIERLFSMLPISPRKPHAKPQAEPSKTMRQPRASSKQRQRQRRRLSPVPRTPLGSTKKVVRPLSPALVPTTVDVFLVSSPHKSVGAVVADADWTLLQLRKRIKVAEFAAKLPIHWRFSFSDGVGILTDQEKALVVRSAKGTVFISSKVRWRFCSS